MFSLTSYFDVVYQDDFILVLNKRSGVVVNNSETTASVTVQTALDAIFTLSPKSDQIPSNQLPSEFFTRHGIVHRLDKDTSGLLLVAKTEEAFLDLQKQFKERNVYKEYLALVIGKLTEDQFEINAPLKRHPINRLKFAVVAGGKEAVTVIEKIGETTFEGETLTSVKVLPKTGRTHQIRVHLAAISHPVVGDALYSSSKQQQKFGVKYPRLMLHALKISFIHPVTQKSMEFTTPVPSEFIV